jgi:hypothetical protein
MSVKLNRRRKYLLLMAALFAVPCFRTTDRLALGLFVLFYAFLVAQFIKAGEKAN